MKNKKFDIHSSIVFQLGNELITDEAQALVELIKNCYDADSSYANVIIKTDSLLERNYRYNKSKGYTNGKNP